MVPINCTGFAVSQPSSMLQRMLLPVISTDVVNVEEALSSIAPAKEGPAAGRIACASPVILSAVDRLHMLLRPYAYKDDHDTCRMVLYVSGDFVCFQRFPSCMQLMQAYAPQ
jgi:hypothetical protein